MFPDFSRQISIDQGGTARSNNIAESGDLAKANKHCQLLIYCLLDDTPPQPVSLKQQGTFYEHELGDRNCVDSEYGERIEN